MNLVAYKISGESPPKPDGELYNYIWAGNGVFIEAKNKLLSARIPVSEFSTRGLENIEPKIELIHGKLSARYFDVIFQGMLLTPLAESYYAVVWENDRYLIGEPAQIGTPGANKYDLMDNTLMDIHSHVPFGFGQDKRHQALVGFSSQDDKDDVGFKIYAMVALGPSCVIRLRVGVYGYFYELDWSDVFDGNPATGRIERVK